MLRDSPAVPAFPPWEPIGAGFINQKDVNPDGFVQGSGGSACAHFVIGGCETFASAGSPLGKWNSATEGALELPTREFLEATQISCHCFTGGKPQFDQTQSIPIGDGMYYYPETPFEMNAGSYRP
jgi:hypothetical protein